MNRKSLVISLFCAFTFIQVNYGQYIPTVVKGNEWTIRLDYGLSNYSYFKYFLGCDTVIQGKEYLTIQNANLGNIGFAREDTVDQIIFTRPLDSDTETKFASFKSEIGDTIRVYGFDVIVEDVRYDTIYGAYRKVIDLPLPFQLIEGVGLASFGISDFYGLSMPWPSVYDFKWIDHTCENPTSVVSVTDTLHISIYPNPFDNEITIVNPTNSEVRYNIFDTYGKQILKGHVFNNCLINTSAWVSGIYFVHTRLGVFKLVKE